MYTAKNHSEGPDKNVIESGGEIVVKSGGKLTIDSGAIVSGSTTAPIIDGLTSTSATSALSAKQGKALKDALDLKADATDIKTAENQAISTATTVELLLADFNALLLKLKTAGLMTADE